MENGALSYVTHQLLAQTPVVLVSIVGLVLSIMFLNRSRWPALLTLSAMVIFLLSTVVFTVIGAYALSARVQGNAAPANISEFLSGMNLIASIVQGIGVCLLLIAVFWGRKRPVTVPET